MTTEVATSRPDGQASPFIDASTLSSAVPSVDNYVDIQSAWNECVELYKRSVDEDVAVRCFAAMASLAVKHVDTCAPMLLGMVQNALDNDPRRFARIAAMRSLIDLAASSSLSSTHIVAIYNCTRPFLETKDDRALTRSSLVVIERLTYAHPLPEPEEEALLAFIQGFLRLDRLRKFFARWCFAILSNIIQRHLVLDNVSSVGQKCLQELYHHLHPTFYTESSSLWTVAFDCVEQLCRQYPQHLSSFTCSSIIELLEVHSEACPLSMKASLFQLLCHCSSYSLQTLASKVSLLQQELEHLPKDNMSKRSIYVILFRLVQTDEKAQVTTCLHHMAQVWSKTEAYDVAHLAFRYGDLETAQHAITRASGHSDNECFEGWMAMLSAWINAEVQVSTAGKVSPQALHAMSMAEAELSASITTDFRFTFQQQFLSLRHSFLSYLMQAQQLASEVAWTNVQGGGRCSALANRCQELATKFTTLRQQHFGAPDEDFELISACGALAKVLSLAIQAFLLLHPVDTTRDHEDGQGVPLARLCMALEIDTRRRMEKLQSLDEHQRPGVGGKVMQQFLIVLSRAPCVVPSLFFRSSVPKERTMSVDAQFLTFAECAKYDPNRSKQLSQLGVSFGSALSCFVKGELKCPSGRKKVATTLRQLRVDVSVYSEVDAEQSELGLVSRQSLYVPLDWTLARPFTSDQRLTFETPVHVGAPQLRAKGAFVLKAQIFALDDQDCAWQLNAPRAQRGFILY